MDLEREADLIEEICRIHGVENIPAQMAPSLPAVSAFDRDWDRLSSVRDTLNALGFDEAVNQTMVGLAAAPAGLAAGDPLPLQNPLTTDMTVLRASLLPGLLQNLRTNVARHQYDVRLFEIGRVFAKDGNESLRLGLAVTGRKSPAAWESSLRGVALDYHDLKGALEELENRLGVELGAEIQTITPAAARKLDLRDAVYLAECRLEAVLAAPRAEIQYRELSRFPAVERDIALIVDESVAHADVLAAIRRHSNKILETVQLFDIFRSSPIPTGKKSLAYALTYRAAERTLTDAEVNQAHDELKRQVSSEIDCELREN